MRALNPFGTRPDSMGNTRGVAGPWGENLTAGQTLVLQREAAEERARRGAVLDVSGWSPEEAGWIVGALRKFFGADSDFAAEAGAFGFSRASVKVLCAALEGRLA